MDLKEQHILGPEIDTHWYYVSKAGALRSLLHKVSVPELLDVGAGSGVFARQLLDARVSRRAICVDPNYAQDEYIERWNGKEIEFRRSVESVSQGLILMIDVLEHIPDDLEFLRSYTDRASPGTIVLISVPAFQFLWSGHDVFLQHQRRYTRTQLENLVQNAGLKLVRSRYFFASLFPFVCASRLYSRWKLQSSTVQPKSALRRHRPLTNALLTWIHSIERMSLFTINGFVGLSVFCLAVRT
jgi:2-polyprenyl-3-methyl-5-hydroxy-6-metoxy-1,4-benzoquinol methylase